VGEPDPCHSRHILGQDNHRKATASPQKQHWKTGLPQGLSTPRKDRKSTTAGSSFRRGHCKLVVSSFSSSLRGRLFVSEAVSTTRLLRAFGPRNDPQKVSLRASFVRLAKQSLRFLAALRLGMTKEEGLGVTEEKGLGVTRGEGLGMTRGEGLRRTREEGLGRTEREVFRMTQGERLGRTEEEGLGRTRGEGPGKTGRALARSDQRRRTQRVEKIGSERQGKKWPGMTEKGVARKDRRSSPFPLLCSPERSGKKRARTVERKTARATSAENTGIPKGCETGHSGCFQVLRHSVV